MPRYSIDDYTDGVTMDEQRGIFDVHYASTNRNQFTNGEKWFSHANSFFGTLRPDQTWVGPPDDISYWEAARVQFSSVANISNIYYELSMDGGETYPFRTTFLTDRTQYWFPITGQKGRLVVITSSTFVPQTPIQWATLYFRGAAASVGSVNESYAVSNGYNVIPSSTRGINVRVINDWFDDYLRGLVAGRSTGFLAGYSDNVDAANFMSVTNITSGFLPHPPLAGVTNLRMASGSIQDSATGTGIGLYFVVTMNPAFEIQVAIVVMNGQTPVNVPGTVYRIIAAFAIGGGATYSNQVVNSNAGIIYLGVGTFSAASGFTTNYALNRIGDGTVVVPTYTCPKGKRATIFELKYGTDGVNAVIFRTFGKDSATLPWQLIIEDVVLSTIQPRRSLIGGFKLPGAEWTVMGRRRSGNSALGNVIATIIEIDEALFESAPGVP